VCILCAFFCVARERTAASLCWAQRIHQQIFFFLCFQIDCSRT
jgi:hypothetical protein